MSVIDCAVTCPFCGHISQETMPPAACLIVYDCAGCGRRLDPPSGECCVFCAFGSVICPARQERRYGCQGEDCS